MNKFTKFATIAITSATIALCGATFAHAADKAPTKGPKPGDMRPVATCADGGTYSNDSGEHRGACSGHGGVIKWTDGSPVHSNKKHSAFTPAK